MKLLVQEYLETHTFGDLVRDHGVYASFSKSGHKWSLNYDQIEAKEADPLAQECRGLILSLKDGRSIFGVTGLDGKLDRSHIEPGETQVLAYPMKRFFNHGQGSAANINWLDRYLYVLEKLDGTLCIVYWDPWKSEWCVATRSVSEADLLMDNGLFTFRSLFEKSAEDTTELTFNALTGLLNKSYTYCFELTTPYNRIVVNYPNNGITLLAVRDLTTHKEVDFSHDVVQYLHGVVPFVQAYAPSSVEEIVNWVSSLNPMEHEGVVVRDSNFNRIKIKNAAYVAASKIRESLATSPRNCLELILLGKDDDVASFLPEEIMKNLHKIKSQLQKVIAFHDETYQLVKIAADVAQLGDKKTFALLVQRTMKLAQEKNKLLWQAPFFQMFDGKASSMNDFIQKNRKDGTWGNSFLDKILELTKCIGE
jgi:hypothetical protein